MRSDLAAFLHANTPKPSPNIKEKKENHVVEVPKAKYTHAGKLAAATVATSPAWALVAWRNNATDVKLIATLVKNALDAVG